MTEAMTIVIGGRILHLPLGRPQHLRENRSGLVVMLLLWLVSPSAKKESKSHHQTTYDRYDNAPDRIKCDVNNPDRGYQQCEGPKHYRQ